MAIDFKKYVELYNSNKDAFHRERLDHIENAIRQMTSNPAKQEQLRAMVWRMDQGLSKHSNPTVRFNALVAEFFKATEKFKDALNGEAPQTSKAEVLPFKPGK